MPLNTSLQHLQVQTRQLQKFAFRYLCRFLSNFLVLYAEHENTKYALWLDVMQLYMW